MRFTPSQRSLPRLSKPVVLGPACEQWAKLFVFENVLQETGLDCRANLGVALEIQLRDADGYVAKH
jgi:hypothetical protein